MNRRAGLIVAVALAVTVATSVTSIKACRRLPGLPADLRPEAAASALQSESVFTTRPNSPVGRKLVAVLAVRRIGRSSTEVEFTWRDTVPPEGQAEAPLRTSMALFRLQDDGEWRVTTLFRVD